MITRSVLVALAASLVLARLPAQQDTGEKPDPKIIDPMVDVVFFELAVYLPPENDKDPLAILDKLLAGKPFSMFQKVATADEIPTRPVVLPTLLTDAKERYRPPSVRLLRFYGRGLSPAQGEALQKVEKAVTLFIAYPKAYARKEAPVVANRLAYELAKATDGYVWDATARLVYELETWKRDRIDSWKNGETDVSKHITIHAYRDGEHVRAITLGMEKFGLPDVVIQKLAAATYRPLGNVMNLFCQSLFEGRKLQVKTPFHLSIREIGHAGVRKRHEAMQLEGATGKARFLVYAVEPEKGDPGNVILALDFAPYEGPDEFARQTAMIKGLYGSKDELTRTRHTEAVLAASKAAKAKLPALRKAVRNGLKPKEQILVKYPFEQEGVGREFMWVEVTAWSGDVIEGLLRNEPQRVKNVKAGQQVKISMAKVFDYIHRHPDGTQTGNETGKIIQSGR